MRVYEAVFDEYKAEGVYALSVVENPAMEDMWIALSEHPKTLQLATVDEEKRLLLGAALIPNKKIYRNIDGNEFYITFSEKTIEKLAHTFFKKQNNNNSSLEHEVKLNGMSVVEGWIVEDPNNDKSNAYGKTYEKGTWVTMMKVDNDDVWSKVKSGEIKGFSIDALLSLKPLELSNNTNNYTMSNKVENFIDKFMAHFDKSEKVELMEEEVMESPEMEEDMMDSDAKMKALAEAIKEILGVEFAKQNEKIESIKAEFATQLTEKENEVKELKAELSKEPEVEGIKQKDASEKTASFEFSAKTPKGRIYEFLNSRK